MGEEHNGSLGTEQGRGWPVPKDPVCRPWEMAEAIDPGPGQEAVVTWIRGLGFNFHPPRMPLRLTLRVALHPTAPSLTWEDPHLIGSVLGNCVVLSELPTAEFALGVSRACSDLGA